MRLFGGSCPVLRVWPLLEVLPLAAAAGDVEPSPDEGSER